MARTVAFDKGDGIAESLFGLVVPADGIDGFTLAVNSCILRTVVAGNDTVGHDSRGVVDTPAVGPSAHGCRIVVQDTVAHDTAVFVTYGTIFTLVPAHDTVLDNTTVVAYGATRTRSRAEFDDTVFHGTTIVEYATAIAARTVLDITFREGDIGPYVGTASLTAVLGILECESFDESRMLAGRVVLDKQVFPQIGTIEYGLEGFDVAHPCVGVVASQDGHTIDNGYILVIDSGCDKHGVAGLTTLYGRFDGTFRRSPGLSVTVAIDSDILIGSMGSACRSQYCCPKHEKR